MKKKQEKILEKKTYNITKHNNNNNVKNCLYLINSDANTYFGKMQNKKYYKTQMIWLLNKKYFYGKTRSSRFNLILNSYF